MIMTHEEILNLRTVRERNELHPDSVKTITKDRAYANGTRSIQVDSINSLDGRLGYEWVIYPNKGTILLHGYTRKKNLSFETREDWEVAIRWIISKIEEIEAMYPIGKG